MVVVHNFFRLKSSVVNYLWNLRRGGIIRKLRSRFGQNAVTIISNNCAAGFIYNALGLRFDSPTINLYFEDSDFLIFTLNLHSYLEGTLSEDRLSDRDYPVGRLVPTDGGRPISVFFMHYETFEQAQKAWDRRKSRVHWDRVAVLWELFDSEKAPSYSAELEAAGIDYRFIVHDKRRRVMKAFVSDGYARAGEAGRIFDKKGVSGKRYLDEFDYVSWLKGIAS